tara:strand:+ start:699 stop:860 length:162 start_codon:yes stop_codon:yes gene_type:complete
MNIEREFIVTWVHADGETERYENFNDLDIAESFLEGLNSPEHFAYLSIVIKRV